MLVNSAFGIDVHPDALVVEEGDGFGDSGLEETAVDGVFVRAVGGKDVAEGKECC